MAKILYADLVLDTLQDKPYLKTDANGKIIDGSGDFGALDLTTTGIGDFGSLVTPYTNTVTVSAAGGDYTTIQAALNANTTQYLLVLVYPGTYTNDTINFTANNQMVVSAGMPKNVIVSNSSQILEVGDYTNCGVVGINFNFTPTTAVNCIEANNGNVMLWDCKYKLLTSSTINGAAQPHILATTGTGTIVTKRGEYEYLHTGDTTNGIKALVSASTGSFIEILLCCKITMTNSGTATASTMFADTGTGRILVENACDITITDTTAAVVAGFGYVGGTGDNEFHGNHVNVVGGGTNACYGIFHAGTGTIKSSYCDYDISGGATNYGFVVAAGATLESDFDNVDAADGNSVAGTLKSNSSYSDGNFTSSGTITGGTLTDGTLSITGGNLTTTGQGTFAKIRANDKIFFTQADENEYIDSLADGYLDLGATTQIRLKQDTLAEASLVVTGGFFPRQVDDNNMDATDGTEGEIVYNQDDNKFYGCTVTGTPATWSALN